MSEAYIIKTMFFVLSKILYFFLSPLSVAIFLLTGAMIAMHKRLFGLSRKLGVASWLVLVAFGVLPTGQYMLAALEARAPYPSELPKKVDGIVLLGGFIDSEIGMKRGTPQLNAAADRLNAFVDMAQKYPYARLVFTSGQGTIAQNGTPEGQMITPLLERMRAYTRTRLTIEDKSRTTYENAIFTKELAKPQPGQTWLLVTSAWHMPRALGTFRAAGWEMAGIPADYQTDGSAPRFDIGYQGFIENMAAAHRAMKEIAGTAIYALTGKWIPSQNQAAKPEGKNQKPLLQ